MSGQGDEPGDGHGDDGLGGLSLNHLTLTVRDLDRAVAFYRDLLGLRLRMRAPASAYLDGAGGLWLCLERSDGPVGTPAGNDSHIAFGTAAAAFETLRARLTAAGVPCWKQNRSEGLSLYILDPDGHKLEIHVGDLESRLAAYRRQPPPGMVVLPD